jgi:hypothetical protein
MIAFAGCTAKNEQTNNTPQGDVQISPGDAKTPGVEVTDSNWCIKSKRTSPGYNGNIITTERMGIVNYEGKEYCLEVITDDYIIRESYFNKTSSFTINKDKSGKIIPRA